MSCRKAKKSCVSLKTHGRIAEIDFELWPILRKYEK